MELASIIALSEAAQNALLVEIEGIALEFAGAFLPADVADDVAHDVVLDCLLRLRAGTLDIEMALLRGFTYALVKRRVVDRVRREVRRMTRDAEHARTQNEGTHAWMSPELARQAAELEALRVRLLARLPPMCRRALIMIRDDHETYEAAAKRLGVTIDAVTSRVVRAQGRMRRGLKKAGVEVPPPRTRNKTSKKNRTIPPVKPPEVPCRKRRRKS